MSKEEHASFSDDMSQLLVRELAFPPVAGQVLAYLTVCDPPAQPINELANALLASRSAITQAVALLEERNLVRRTRARGERMDRVAAIFDAARFEQYFDTSSYIEQARLIRQAITLLPVDDKSGRRSGLEEVAALNEFFAEKYTTFKKEWIERLAQLRATNK